ncbi:hypothetical protein [Massilia sp. ST3]|uniref:hypothetical protein n=1 Tax=Massilia sp. ST3 TaxID=2824903 RepID=UPI001B84027F|nr:hypothetical protein [Massilia sp. ST3]MBQ5947098.1 hypothetical protein [Massilia sp. ST3]
MLQTSTLRPAKGVNFGLAAFLGVPGIYDLIEGGVLGNHAEAIYGAGRVLCAIFLIGSTLQPSASSSGRSRLVMAILGYAGIMIGTAGLMMKHQIFPG